MRILEFKHVAGYLPYGLAYAKCTEKSAVTLAPETTIEGFVSTIGDIHNLNNTILADYSSGGFKYKPILRSLKSLTKEIVNNEEKFIPIEWFEIGDDENDSLEYDHGNIKLIKSLESLSKNLFANDINFFPYGVVQKLHEWRFDTKKLIEKGLALDVDNLILNPYTFK